VGIAPKKLDLVEDIAGRVGIVRGAKMGERMMCSKPSEQKTRLGKMQLC
jgi:hypothetical protein